MNEIVDLVIYLSNSAPCVLKCDKEYANQFIKEYLDWIEEMKSNSEIGKSVFNRWNMVASNNGYKHLVLYGNILAIQILTEEYKWLFKKEEAL